MTVPGCCSEDFPCQPNSDLACSVEFWTADENAEVDAPWMCTLDKGHAGPHAGHMFGPTEDTFVLVAVADAVDAPSDMVWLIMERVEITNHDDGTVEVTEGLLLDDVYCRTAKKAADICHVLDLMEGDSSDGHYHPDPDRVHGPQFTRRVSHFSKMVGPMPEHYTL